MFLGLFILSPAKRNLLFQKSRDTDGSSCGFVHLFTKRPCFLFLLVSILLVYISYTAINNFHINIIESVGGGSPELESPRLLRQCWNSLPWPCLSRFPKRFPIGISFLSPVYSSFSRLFNAFSKNISGIYLSQCLQFSPMAYSSPPPPILSIPSCPFRIRQRTGRTGHLHLWIKRAGLQRSQRSTLGSLHRKNYASIRKRPGVHRHVWRHRRMPSALPARQGTFNFVYSAVSPSYLYLPGGMS